LLLVVAVLEVCSGREEVVGLSLRMAVHVTINRNKQNAPKANSQNRERDFWGGSKGTGKAVMPVLA
jgi:hypothetical protein